MQKIIKPLTIEQKILGTITVPPSKSIMQRILAISLLNRGILTIENSSFCDDSLAAIEIIKSLGAEVEIDKSRNQVKISSDGELNCKKNIILNCNESATSLRVFSLIASLYNSEITLTGKGSLLKRPSNIIKETLEQLGIKSESNNGFLPIKFTGGIKGKKNIRIDASISSQLLTGLLISMPKTNNDINIEVENLISKPYIDMTINLLEKFGIKIINRDYNFFFIKGNQEFEIRNTDFLIEGDWSGASFLLVAVAIAGGRLKIDTLNSSSTQADKEILVVLKKAGIKKIVTENCSITIEKSINEKLSSFSFDATDCPDLFPPIVALASYCSGITEIKGLNRLRHKESDRGEVLKREFSKLGVRIDLYYEDDVMKIYGGNKLYGGVVDSNNDHRIAMALALLGLKATEDVVIENSDCVNKSYNNFFTDLEKLKRRTI